MTPDPNELPPTIPLSAVAREDVLVDLRSPSEYRQGHIPGARSLPILDDAERHEVGLTYQTRGPEEAQQVGIRMVSPRLPAMIAELAGLAAGARVVLYCWRGGMRSRLITDLVRGLGHRVTRLAGGYRTHRRRVVKVLEGPFPPLTVLHGYTGSGKTRLLRALAGEFPVLDLEHLASHRGSTFGHVGLAEQPGQKQFESALVGELDRLGALSPGFAGTLLVEGESATIGRIHLPPALCRAMRGAPSVFVELPRAERVRLLLEDYGGTIRENLGVIADSLGYLKSRQPRRLMEELAADLAGGRHAEFCSKLLEHHYDPLYERAFRKRQDREVLPLIRAESLDRAFAGLRTYLREISRKMHLASAGGVL